MLSIGVKEDSFETFIVDIYNRCKEIGFLPENISSCLQDLLHFSRNDVVPLSKLQDYIKKKADAESLRNKALKLERVTSSELRWYSDFVITLRTISIICENILKLHRTQLSYR
jgi:hypothetical protein